MTAEALGSDLPQGFLVGHWTDAEGCTGCTVVLAPDGAVGGVDVRGAASSTLCTDTLRPDALVEQAHAVLLTGGSAFGLEAASGVMRYLEERELGYKLAGVTVPIVVGAVIFDLPVGDPRARPDRDAGYAACVAAGRNPEQGSVGGGAGATVAKAGDRSQLRRGGVGIATGRVATGGADIVGGVATGGAGVAAGGAGIAAGKLGEARVAAVMVVNSVGGIWDEARHEWVAELDAAWDGSSGLVAGANTTIGAVITDAKLSKSQANRVATVAHDGIARAIRPAHTMYDGDTLFCLASGAVEAPYDAIEVLATDLVARAIAAGVRAAQA